MGLTQGLLSTLVADTCAGGPARQRRSACSIWSCGIALLVASVIAGGLWDAFGPRSTFLAGAGITVVAWIALGRRRINALRGGC